MESRLHKSIAVLAILGGLLFVLCFISLNRYFDYPEMIRANPEVLLGKLYETRSLVPYLYYFGVGVGGLCLFFTAMLLRKGLELRGDAIWGYMGSFCGMIHGFLLYSGIIRYTFLFPFLAEKRIEGQFDSQTIDLIFEALNTHIGNAVTEHVGFTFTAMMQIFFNIAIVKTGIAGRWVAIIGFITALLTMYGNLEFMVRLPGTFPANRMASAFLAVWLLSLGISILHRGFKNKQLVATPSSSVR